jgi:TonB-linked SusC/RagA family outer membrane protein
MKGNLQKYSTCIFKAFLVFSLLFSSNYASAQKNIRVKGKIVDEKGESLPGASVSVKGKKMATQTDLNGSYVLLVPAEGNPILVFNFLGYKRQEVIIGDKTTIDVTLSADSKSLEEVVIIGYGQVDRKDLTGSISTIRPTKESAVQFTSVDALIRGRAAGVQVTEGNGSPGGGISVKIRGVNSLRGNNEPLYVVDGIIIANSVLDTREALGGGGQNASNQESQNGLTGINTQDIESIEILKDASATAIYGSRGANGVVIITTKQGKAGAPQINFSSNTEIAKVSKQLDVLDGFTYATYQNDLNAVRGLPARYDTDTLQYIYWQNDLQQTALKQNYRVAISGASMDSKTKYYIAGGLIDAIGVIKNSGIRQSDLKLNLTQQLSPKIVTNVRVAGAFTNTNAITGTERLGTGNNNAVNQMITAAPVLNDLPDLSEEDGDAPFNPRVWIEDFDDLSNDQRILANADVTYKISKSFSYKLNLSTDYRNKERVIWQGKTTQPGQRANGALGLAQLQRKYFLVENLLFYKKQLKNKDKIDATFGVTYDNDLITSSSVQNTNFFSGALGPEGFGLGEILLPYARDKSEAEIFSTLGRVNYVMGDKFIFTISGRLDGSSKFAEGNKYGFFPSAAMAYRLINENFMKNLSTVSDFKIRAGYGESGNQGIDPYATFSRYGNNRYSNDGNAVTIGSGPSNIANPNLKWETTRQFNAGVDLGFFKDRLTATVDVYHKTTVDLLQSFNLPLSAGFNSIVINRGSLENTGLEIALNGVILDTKDLNWTISPNISFNRNKLLNLGLPEGTFGTMQGVGYIGQGISTSAAFKDPANIFLEGQPIGLFYGYKTDGVFQDATEAAGKTDVSGVAVQPGDLRFVDQNNDGFINDDDKVLLGDPNPKFNFGLNTSVTYKRFNFNVFVNGVYGNDVVNGNSIRLNNLNAPFNVLADAYNSAWTATNPTDNPRVGYENLSFIDRHVEDGSFLRLATATIVYRMPLKANVIKQIDFAVTGTNLFVLTKYSGFDPEVNSFAFDANRIGVDWNAYPRTRGVMFGLNVKF